MQPGAPGRSSSVSERRPRRGGGGGGDGGGSGGGGGAPPPDKALPAREAAFGRRVQQRVGGGAVYTPAAAHARV
eukprot:scaffold64687_cov74-Phaeocystis_antarctica.AAC.2